MAKKLFYRNQSIQSRNMYKNLLVATGSLSKLYTNSINPFLYYRAMENIFCKSFEADDLARSDVSVDATKDKTGIGLKTFLHSNGNTFQKIAEFNKQSYMLRDLSDMDLMHEVSRMRNERIRTTKIIYNLESVMYHYITRSSGLMNIYEESMDFINLNKLKITNSRETTLHFTDGVHEYNYNKSKSTLLKRFNTENLESLEKIDIEILEDPFDFLLQHTADKTKEKVISSTTRKGEEDDFIILPLYSERSGKVEKKSGLNMWNAKGRARHHNEVYIPIPIWIHRLKPGFFQYKDSNNRTESFQVILPNKKTLSMKVTQQNGKALQSDPNKELGKWILRDILELNKNQLVTKKDLDIIGIDSIKLSKINDKLYKMNFLEVGSFEDFKDNLQKK